MPESKYSEEWERLRALISYKIMDTEPEESFQSIVEIASEVCDTPIALVTFLNEEKQWFKANLGIDIKETKREHAFCAHAIRNPEDLLEVQDSLADDRFRENPLTTGTPNIRFYAGAPIVTPDGQPLGTVCVIDQKPKQLSEKQKKALKALSKQVVALLELRKKNFQLHKLKEEAQNAAEEFLKNKLLLTNIANSLPGLIMSYNLAEDGSESVSFVSKGAKNLWGFTPDEVMQDISLVWNNIHPDDIRPMKMSIQQSADRLTVWNTEYRYFIAKDKVKWIKASGTPQRKKDGSIQWHTLALDVTKRKNTEQKNSSLIKELENHIEEKNTLIKEVHHRVKNNLQLVSSVLYMKALNEKNDKVQLFIEETISRVKTISDVHEYLLEANAISQMKVRDYILNLVNSLIVALSSEPDEYELNTEIDDLKLNTDFILNLGVIVNELTLNTLKYAYDLEDEKSIYISLKMDNDLKLIYADKGKGMSDGDIKNKKSTGLQIVEALAAEKGGSLTVDGQNGLRFEFTFKV